MRAARQGRAAPAVPAPEKCLPARGFSVESANVTAGSAGRERRVTSGKDDEEFFRQRGFGIKMGFGERPALIVIDMIKGFTDSNMPLGANLDTQIAAQTPLVEVAHERGIPVIFSTVVY